MSDERYQSPFLKLDEIMKKQPPVLESPLQVGTNIFDDPYFVAAFEGTLRRTLRVFNQEVTIDDHIMTSFRNNGEKVVYRQALKVDRDERDMREIVLSNLTRVIARRLDYDDEDMAPGHTERRIRQYNSIFRGPRDGGVWFNFLQKSQKTDTGLVRNLNVGALIGIELITVNDQLIPLWITYLKEIYEKYPLSISASGYVVPSQSTEVPVILSYTEWALQRRLSFDEGIVKELRFLAYRATLRRFQKENPLPPIEE